MNEARLIIVCVVACLMIAALTALYCLVPRNEASKPSWEAARSSHFEQHQTEQQTEQKTKSKIREKSTVKQEKKDFSKPFAFTFSVDSKQDIEQMRQAIQTEGNLANAY